MARRLLAVVVVLAGLMAGLQIAGAAPRTITVTLLGGATATPASSFEGEVNSKRRPCRANQIVKIVDSATGAVLARTKTGRDGTFSVPRNGFTGTAHAVVAKKARKCKRASSAAAAFPTLAAPGPSGPRADLSLAMIANGVDGMGRPKFVLAVMNHGPDTATGIAIVDSASTGTIWKNSGGQPCAPDDGNPITCSVGALPTAPVNTFQIELTFTCGPLGGTSNMATVSFAGTDPNPANNSADASLSC